MKFKKIISFCQKNDIEFEQLITMPQATRVDVMNLFLGDYMLAIYDTGSKPSVELYTDINGEDGEIYEYGRMTQNEIIGIIMGAMVQEG